MVVRDFEEKGWRTMRCVRCFLCFERRVFGGEREGGRRAYVGMVELRRDHLLVIERTFLHGLASMMTLELLCKVTSDVVMVKLQSTLVGVGGRTRKRKVCDLGAQHWVDG